MKSKGNIFRLGIVILILVAIAAAIFIPYYIGELVEKYGSLVMGEIPSKLNSYQYWGAGLFFSFIIMCLGIAITEGAVEIIDLLMTAVDYIIYGKDEQETTKNRKI